jgi:hypothetical protein
MKTLVAAAILLTILMPGGAPAFAHRLDEYLQATLISIEKDRIEAQIRLTPGVAVLPFVLAKIDTNGDGVILEAEQRAYTAQVLRDLSFTMDGDRLPLHLVSAKFPKVAEMKEGLGEIQIEFDADLPRGGSNRRLVFENHHQGRIGAYLVNCLTPRDPDIRIMSQTRNYQQSVYELDYVQSGAWQEPPFSGWLSAGVWFGMALVLIVRFGVAASPLRRLRSHHSR